LAVVVLSAGYFFWLRDSSLVSVEAVRVEGIDPRAQNGDELQAALEAAAKEMTTLHVRSELLTEAIKPFPLVESVKARADFPHKLTLTVIERRPTALIETKDERLAVASDGTLLPALALKGFELPRLALENPPDKSKVEGPVSDQIGVLAAAPDALLALAESARGDAGGVTVTMRGGIELRFGDAVNVREKWRAAAAILSDPGIGELGYVDLSSPSRAAIGGIGATLPEAG